VPGPASDVYEAVAHPLRRRILRDLARGERTVGELAAPHPVSRPAVSQHLRVLREAGLVRERRDGRQRCYGLDPRPLQAISDWLVELDAFWAERLGELRRHLDGRP
jgi:DNA-binding transcriptional ArsR family regulator